VFCFHFGYQLHLWRRKWSKKRGKNEWSRHKLRIWLNITTNLTGFHSELQLCLWRVANQEEVNIHKRVQKEWIVSPQIKNLTKLGSNSKSSFPSFWAPITPTKKSNKEKIATLDESKTMKVMVVNQGPRLNQETYFNYSFLFVWRSTYTHKEFPKKEYKCTKMSAIEW